MLKNVGSKFMYRAGCGTGGFEMSKPNKNSPDPQHSQNTISLRNEYATLNVNMLVCIHDHKRRQKSMLYFDQLT
jgi:hypothetical protein